jgi:hypothetical protein
MNRRRERMNGAACILIPGISERKVAYPEAENPASVKHFKLMGCTFIRVLKLS